jgi:NAD(P)-dependent dehydrogenase (short-subunit alcohol dehydrogenase family)
MLICVKYVGLAMAKQEVLYRETRFGKRSMGRGSIVNMGSGFSVATMPGLVSYTASKHAVLGLTKTAALDLAADEIRVNAVCPSWVKGPMMDALFNMAPPLKDFIHRAVPFKRICDPDEVGEVIVFLASPAASYVTGTYVMVDAGVTLTCHV